MDSKSLELFESLLKQEISKRRREDPAGWFPWHGIQEWLLDAPDLTDRDTRIMLIAGGNRGGKSAIAKGIYSQTVRRSNKLSKQFQMLDPVTGTIRRKSESDPMTIWIIPPTLEKARQDWVSPTDGYSIRYWLGDLFIHEQKTPDYVFYSRPPGMTDEEVQSLREQKLFDRFDKTILKSHDQDLLSFEASAVDLVIVDEELLDEKKWNSLLLRIGTTHGCIVMAYTPLHGLSWSYDRYWRPLIKLNRARSFGDRRWMFDGGKGAVVVLAQFGASDNPLAATYAEEIRSDPGMSEAEKAARLDGEYGFVEGALIPQLSGLDIIAPERDQEIYVVDQLPGRFGTPGRIVQWLIITDPNKSYGAVLCAVDQDGNLFFVKEHLKESWPDRLHAEVFKAWEKNEVSGPLRRLADPGSAGSMSIINMKDLGLIFEAVSKGSGSVSDGIKQLRSLAWIDPNHHHPISGKKGAPRLYFYRPGMVSDLDTGGRGCMLADQISQARQTDNPNAAPDTPHKSIKLKLDLFDCARYAAREVARSNFVGSGDSPFSKMNRQNRIFVEDKKKEEFDPTFYSPEYMYDDSNVGF